jgi:surface carbohydrate biosynthesis protein (TIGR04326 family)
MERLIVIDECRPRPAGIRVAPGDVSRVLPLTSSSIAVEIVVRGQEAAGARVEVLPTGELVNQAAERRRGSVLESASLLSRLPLPTGETLPDWFSLGDGSASAWWFSRVVEKSPYKSDTFLRWAQWDVIVESFRRWPHGELVYVGGDSIRGRMLERLAREGGVRFQRRTALNEGGFFRRWRRSGRFAGGLECALVLAGAWNAWRVGRLCRRWLRGVRPDPSQDPPLVLCSHYPHFDEERAKSGTFANAYFGSLSDSLKAEGREVAWLLIHTRSPRWSAAASLHQARAFVRHGARLRFVQEAVTWRTLMHALWENARLGLRRRRRRSDIRELARRAGAPPFELAESDWRSSFGGVTGFEGILWYRAFRDFFRKSAARRVLFSTEAHAWEKGLLLARDAERPEVAVIGYQSATVSRYLLNYWNTPSDFIPSEGLRRLPQPDRLICDGDAPRRGFLAGGWPKDRLILGEALRYHHLDGALKQDGTKRLPIVLVALSIAPSEAAATLAYLRGALRDWNRGEVWVRAHPFLDIERRRRSPGEPFLPENCRLARGPLSDQLRSAAVVIAGESSVTLEALAHGCPIIAVNAPDCLNMSPLRDYGTDAYVAVSTPAALRYEIDRRLSALPSALVDDAERERVVRDFFELAWEVPARVCEPLR